MVKNVAENTQILKSYTFPKIIDFPRYNTKCSRKNEILHGIFCVVSRFPLHFVLFLGNLYYLLNCVVL